MDLTATTRTLAEAVGAAARLLPANPVNPVLSGLLLCAGATGLTLAGNDHERAIRLECAATVHTDGAVLVPAAPLAETLRALEDPLVRLVVEGNRLAIRVPGGRFALPLLNRELHPGPLSPPPRVAEADGDELGAALRTVAGTASRDDSLPLFTGVRLRLADGRLHLVASDRYRLASARLPVRSGEGPLDVLVPATLLAEIARQASGTVGLHADGNRFGLHWADTTVSTALLDAGFLSEDAIAVSTVDTVVELAADALAAATRRVSLYTDPRKVLTLAVGEAEVRLSGTNLRDAEAEETVKAAVHHGRTSPSFQARYLLDALRPFAGERVRLEIQPGMKATVVRAVDPGPVEVTYYVMPMRPPGA
ncbi:DNA polymerase III subunit beta [Amycolatopsis anabasis]|uniref:DNA polymerase III subunit beta n=1 Tax=Amycolatopsis anabasis TaxID=1840409 RepID=UPI00131CDF89|nr:DNA polymerase III subunit beta [Amycolatopsis anabasis]